MVRVGALSQPRGGEKTASGGSAPRCVALSRGAATNCAAAWDAYQVGTVCVRDTCRQKLLKERKLPASLGSDRLVFTKALNKKKLGILTLGYLGVLVRACVRVMS